MGSTSVPMAPLSPSVRKALPKAIADLTVHNVVLGDIQFKTWYPSFYPEELVGRNLQRLYVCQWCFKYSEEATTFLAHERLCPSRRVMIGTLIYAKDSYGIYEVDGEKHQLFTQNLSLFAKLFLDNKSVFFDIVSFNYYLLVQSPSSTSTIATTIATTTTTANNDEQVSSFSLDDYRIVGFFSKEKVSWDNNNLACILVFPPWQGQGLGKILMGISYELSKREGRIGGPERPLSELGRKGYTQFWRCRVANQILAMKAKTTLSVGELAELCWILPEDAIVALKEISGALSAKKKADGSAVVSKSKIRDWVRANGVDLTPPVCEDGFVIDRQGGGGGGGGGVVVGGGGATAAEG